MYLTEKKKIKLQNNCKCMKEIRRFLSYCCVIVYIFYVVNLEKKNMYIYLPFFFFYFNQVIMIFFVLFFLHFSSVLRVLITCNSYYFAFL